MRMDGMRALRSALALLLLGTTVAARAEDNQLTADEKARGWRLLFDGKTLGDWKMGGRKEGWTIEQDALACMVRGGGYLSTNDQFADFILTCDFMTAPRCNSGIFLRWDDPKSDLNAFEIQILDSFGRVKPNKHDCGALYDIQAPAVDAVKPAGEWNHIEITLQGPILRVVLNRQQVVHLDMTESQTVGVSPDGARNKFPFAPGLKRGKGRIAFQDHGGRVWYKNIKIRELPPFQPPVHG